MGETKHFKTLNQLIRKIIVSKRWKRDMLLTPAGQNIVNATKHA